MMTGGLGPTDDDLTREVVASVLGRALVEDAEVLAGIRARFERRQVAMPAINRRQAMVPVGAAVLPNPNGTAPGLVARGRTRRGRAAAGPAAGTAAHVRRARLAAACRRRPAASRLRRRVLKMTGRSESQVEEIAFPIYSALGDATVPVQTTILASPGQIELHLEAVGEDVAAPRRAAGRRSGRTRRRARRRGLQHGRPHPRGSRRRAPAHDGARIAVAESCTGGLVQARLTDVPGSSAWVARRRRRVRECREDRARSACPRR